MNANSSDGGACRVAEWVFVSGLGRSHLQGGGFPGSPRGSLRGRIPHCTVIAGSGS